MTNSEQALRDFAEKQFPLSKELKKEALYNQIQQAKQNECFSDLTALISEHYVAKEEVDKMVSERSEFIKKAVIRFFYTEVDLNFCTREYRDRVEWYFNTYQHEIFKLPKTSLDNFKSREK